MPLVFFYVDSEGINRSRAPALRPDAGCGSGLVSLEAKSLPFGLAGGTKRAGHPD